MTWLLVLQILTTLFSQAQHHAHEHYYNAQAHASYYETGQETASGEIFNPEAFTCAGHYLPFGTQLLLERDGVCTLIRMNDRGPWDVDSLGHAIIPLRPHPYRQLDLSRRAFANMGPLEEGTLTFRVLGIFPGGD
jgi:rare lipoprotein A